jgi:CubicO group peptidase (beta-lactamase class C family)
MLMTLVALEALPAQSAEVGRLLDSTVRAAQLPAMAAAIVTRDSILVYEARGVRKKDDPTPVTRDDRFEIGSNTKAVTAGLVGLLVDEGRIAWTTTLAEIFPELATRMRTEYRGVTVRDLLTHHGGLVRDAKGDFGRGTPRAQRERFVPWVLTQRPASPRGTVAYSNAGYILAGAIIERIVGESYEQFVVRRLLAPLGLTTAGFGPPATPGKVDQPWGHSDGLFGRWHMVAPEQENSDFARLYSPAGQLHLSIHDWALWSRVLLRAASGGPSPWKPETVAALLTPPVPSDSMAMGWQVLTRPWAKPGGRILVHDGSNMRFFSVAVLAPEGNFGVLVMTNRGPREGAEAGAGLANRLIKAYTSGRLK